IFVSFTDENPSAAQIAVREMIHAFQVVSEEEGGQPLNNKVATLTDDASRLRQQISAKDQEIRQVLRDNQERGSDDLAAIYGRYRQQLIDLELGRAQAESALLIAHSYAATDGKQPTTMPSLTDDQLARVDSRMFAMCNERDN